MYPSDISPQIVALRAAPHANGVIQISLARLRALLLSGLSQEDRRLLLTLGATTTSGLRAVAANPRSSATASAAFEQLAEAAESAALTSPVASQVAVTGHGALAQAVRSVIRPYAARLTRSPDVLGPDEASYDVPDLAVGVSEMMIDVSQAQVWRDCGVPFLPVVHHGDRMSIGPVVAPQGGPCARCLELSQADRDPGRAALAAALAHDTPPTGDPDPALTALAAGLAGLTVRNVLTGHPVPAGVGLVVALPHPRVSHHSWRQHPRCPCVTMGS
ncbi:TOMM precursor leader peptide-binding protein [Luteipulveratus mongoliensis]|uniref:THIF-type NAD/FAD binding fold domain-containing protein n=1 Tax=Luteipulveratus mongoliensis TaxID=571913 RepID=A0A0K1JLY6_9MICO|nr:TOMM precursor leader peptide-binding protein [Luteipulveratus mongoliensis]AKU17605.1 hypothetical protein VV02_20085 [Luteipulveratus mongoliensis]